MEKEQIDKWICSKCNNEIYFKPKRNEHCKCGGRYRHYTKCECGNWFNNPGNDKRYCCKECAKKFHNVILKCMNCNKLFNRAKSNHKSKKSFCCKKCVDEYNLNKKEKRICKHCGKEFNVYKSAIDKTNATGNYCCLDCYYSSMRFLDKPHRYGKQFKENKRKYFNNSFCVLCGTNKNIHIHHIIPFRLTHDNNIDNLIPLCSKHHIIFENMTREILKDFNNYKSLKLALRSILFEKYYVTKYILENIGEKYENNKCKNK